MARRTTICAATAAGAAALGLGAAAVGSAAPDRPASTTVRLSANAHGLLKFNTRTLHARHGTVTIVMRNPSSSGIPHAIGVEGHGVDRDGRRARPGHSSTITVRLKHGRYEFYCPIDGHKAAGMKGTLIVS